jgi:hypothetical protein
MFDRSAPFRLPFVALAAAVAALALGACSSSPSIQGSPPLSEVPVKIKTFTAPYLDNYFGPGMIGAAMLLGPNFLPGRCEGMYMQGDRRLVCEQLARFNDTPEPGTLPDPNARYRCIRTLGGVTECSAVAPAPKMVP